MLTILLLVGSALAECYEPTSLEDVQVLMSSARYAWLLMDYPSFGALADEVDRQLPCLGEPLQSHASAQIHLQEAIRRYLSSEPEASAAAFRSVLTDEPTFKLTEALAPAGHPLRDCFDEALDEKPVRPQSLPLVPGSRWSVDGEPAIVAPLERPFLLQRLSLSGGVAWTGYLRPGDPLPLVEGSSQPLGKAPKSPSNLRAPLLGAAITSGVAGAVLYTVAAIKGDGLGLLCEPELGSTRTEVNTLVLASTGLGVVALGSGTAALVVWRH